MLRHDDTVVDPGVCELAATLLDQFLAVGDEKGAATLGRGVGNDTGRHKRFPGSSGHLDDDASGAFSDFCPSAIFKIDLIGTQDGHED